METICEITIPIVSLCASEWPECDSTHDYVAVGNCHPITAYVSPDGTLLIPSGELRIAVRRKRDAIVEMWAADVPQALTGKVADQILALQGVVGYWPTGAEIHATLIGRAYERPP